MTSRIDQKELDLIRGLRTIYGASYAQIGRLKGCSAEAVRQLVERYNLDQAEMSAAEFTAHVKENAVNGNYFGQKCPMTFANLLEMAERGVILKFAAPAVGLTEKDVEEWFEESPGMGCSYSAHEALFAIHMIGASTRGAPHIKPADARRTLETHPTTKKEFTPPEQERGNTIIINGWTNRHAALQAREEPPAIEGQFTRLPPQENQK